MKIKIAQIIRQIATWGLLLAVSGAINCHAADLKASGPGSGSAYAVTIYNNADLQELYAMLESANLLQVRSNYELTSESFDILKNICIKAQIRQLDLKHVRLQESVLPPYAFCVPALSEDNEELALERVVLPESMVEIGNGAFENIATLRTVVLGQSLQRIGKRAFDGCLSLKINDLIMPSSVEEIDDYAFYGCSATKETLTLPAALRRIGRSAFAELPIGGVVFPDNLEEIGGSAFSGCLIAEVTLPEGCLSFPGKYHFAHNSALSIVVLPAGMNSIPEGFFEDCPNIKNVTLPSGLQEIGAKAFSQCSVEEIVVPEGVTEICEFAFFSNPIKELHLPSTLKNIGAESFSEANLKKIYCGAVLPPRCVVSDSRYHWTSIGAAHSFNTLGWQETGKYIYIPKGTKEEYMKAPGWNEITEKSGQGSRDQAECFVEIDF